MAETILEATARILTNPAPVVLLDTCAILDIIRTPLRNNISSDTISAARKLITRTQESPRRAWMAIYELVSAEWLDNSQSIRNDVTRSLAQLESRLAELLAIAHQLSPALSIPTPELSTFGLDTLLLSASEELKASALVISENNDCLARAAQRVIQNVPPASKGKQELKDCAILEHYLEFSKTLREQGFIEAIYFVTSNTSDYGRPGSMDSRLQADLDSARITYATSLPWVDALLK